MELIPIYRWDGRGSQYVPGSMGYDLVGYAKVDDWWYDRLMAMGLWLEEKGHRGVRYARLSGKDGGRPIKMHQVIGGKGWDHRDGDGLNNQESNLRPASSSDQTANQGLRKDSITGEPGVTFNKAFGKWLVKIVRNRKRVFYKSFSSFSEAVAVAREKRREIHGEFVRGQ